MADGTKAPKGWLIAGVVLLLLGIGGCGTAIIGAGSLASLADDITNTSPYGEPISFTSESNAGGLVLLTSDAECAGADGSGAPISFETVGADVAVDNGQDQFTNALTFDTVDGQTYQLTCGDLDAALGSSVGSFTVLRLPSVLSGTTAVLVFAVGGAGGALFLLLGVIFLIVGLVRRSKWKKQRNQFGGPPAGMAPPAPGGMAPPPAPGGMAPPPAPGGMVPPPAPGGSPLPPAPGMAPPAPGGMAPPPAPGGSPLPPVPPPPGAAAPPPAAPPAPGGFDDPTQLRQPPPPPPPPG